MEWPRARLKAERTTRATDVFSVDQKASIVTFERFVRFETHLFNHVSKQINTRAMATKTTQVLLPYLTIK